MLIKRVIEVWGKGMDGALLAQWPVADTISPQRLLQMFVAEQRQPDPDMLLSYFLDKDKLAALQPYVAQQLEADRHDYILTAFGMPSARARAAEPDDEAEPFD
ncbi:hypothetical protein FNU76_09880 [Chitinimonas arctica]|uniref:Uncharacterized protein n=1 Tax=Chitinimonas arctica TaxID=2594795 RepID=A0A516SF42_9NEIS|nr:hypothetical protein [Chitinimonas arctica]QDQ26648.1 hypothetical protein FNU76_09880 [Chitinimonas arctica]